MCIHVLDLDAGQDEIGLTLRPVDAPQVQRYADLSGVGIAHGWRARTR
ncbi:hypothetical protein [Streptomyces sp. MUM 178J]|nr:hypothetical protein [Streptomyces sp. MUM 178J]WRQ82802.1 hypothetical protein I3F59_027575 [Streptomyces sp. MUM 178J]